MIIRTLLLVFILSHIIVAQDTVHASLLRTVATQLSFPEGPVNDGTGRIFFSNCYSDWIGILHRDVVTTWVKKPTKHINFGKTNGLLYTNDGYLIACDYGEGKILQFNAEGECKVLIDSDGEKRFNRPNDIASDPHGNFYFTDPKSYDTSITDGRVFYFSRTTNKLTLATENLSFPNGIAVSPDGLKLYVCESAKHQVSVFDITEDGLLNKRLFARIPWGDPDGIAFDTKGNLYIAVFGGGRVVQVSPDGEVIKVILTPGKKPSNIEFGGEGNQTLYVTECETNAIYSLPVEVPGFFFGGEDRGK